MHGMTDQAFKYYLDLPLEPISIAGKRIVTTHGDIHYSNVIKNTFGDIYLVDLEHICVSYAVNDLSYFFMAQMNEKSLKDKLSFCKTYLEALNLESIYNIDEQAELLLFDIQNGYMTAHWESELRKSALKIGKLEEIEKEKIRKEYKKKGKELSEESLKK